MNAAFRAVAKRGEKIYRERYKAEYERSHAGQYVAIDVNGGQPFVAATPESALRAAVDTIPDGRFHLILVGAPAAFKVGYARCGNHSGNRDLAEGRAAHRSPSIRS
jgi:hypothetical protein